MMGEMYSANIPLRILYVVPKGQGKSSMVFAHKEIASIKSVGHKTKTVMFNTSSAPRMLWKEMIRLKRAVEEYKPDIIHAHYGTITAFICAFVAYIKGVPLIVTFRGSDLNPSPYDGNLRNIIQKILSHISAFGAKKNICVSFGLKNKLWWCSWKTTVIPSGIDLDLFKPVKKDVARNILDWGQNEYIVCFNGGISQDVKRLDVAENAVEVIRKLIGEVRFVVMRADVEHDHVPLYLSGADCLLLTSDYEGSPDIVKEALACNLPIVSVDVGDVRERLLGVNHSKIVERDPESIARAAAEIITAGKRSNGRSHVEDISNYYVREKILLVYRACISRRKSTKIV